jgi:restriction endonuclease S subunit
MSCDFDNCLLADVADLIRGVSYKPQDLIAVSGDQATALLRATNIGINELELTDVLYVPSKLVKNPQQLIKFDVVIAMSSGSRKAVGRLAQLRQNWNGTFGAFCGVIRPKVEKIDPAYLGYVLHSPEFRARIDTFAAGTAIMNLTKDSLLNFPIKLPPKQVQVQVAQILGSLDDRINLLRETNLTLGAIAQSLFKSWFVDFDPVRAKQVGKLPEGMDTQTATLFPDDFEHSELGEIPKGWNISTFRNTIEIIGGGTPKTSIPEYWGGDIPWFSVVDAPHISDVFVVDTDKHITEAGLKCSSTKLLAVGTTIISARGTVGRIALTGCPMTMNQSCYGLQGKAGDQFYTFFNTNRMVDQLKQRAHGSVFDTITQETFSGILVCYPTIAVVQCFDKFIEPLMLKIRENLLLSNNLGSLRDTLIPRLISGQIRLPDAEEQIEAATA